MSVTNKEKQRDERETLLKKKDEKSVGSERERTHKIRQKREEKNTF